MKVHIVIGGVDGEEIEVYARLAEAQRRCGVLNTERRRIRLQEQYDHRVVSRPVLESYQRRMVAALPESGA